VDQTAFYDAMWKRYAHLDAVSPAAFHRRRLVVKIAREAAPNARSVLDAGCGPGDLLGELAAAFPGARIAGADVSGEALIEARSKLPTAELFTLDLAKDTREELAAKGPFDVVVCSEVLEHLADDLSGAEKLSALVAPGGALIATVPGGKMSRFDVAIGHHRHYRPQDLERLLSRAGFQVDRVLAWGFPFHSLYRTMVRVASRASFSDTATHAPPERDVSSVLGRAYSLVGRALKPAFYFNLDRWGEQMIAVARRRG
jgi:SAM-dependent methyltransferase